ncbi:MAG: nuclear transport factor 2 family protein [Chloroflexi bacterium]|nr:nuclear transport factor 2 family protein [Chloroflexota bacterium]
MRKGVLAALVVLLLAGCAGGDSGAGDPAEAVERYIQAKIAADAEAVRALLCSDMEADFDREAGSFAGVEARLEGMDCRRDGDTNVVRCQGKIVATYGPENLDFPLTAYRVVLEGGVWKWCGEAG